MERRPTESSAIPDRKRCRVSESSPQNSENPYKKTGHISPVFDFKKYYYYWQNGQMKKPANSRKTNEEISDFDHFVQNRRSLQILIHRKSVSV